jgi:hypothetical protein
LGERGYTATLLAESQLAPTIALERYAAADDTDSVTSQTVALMCRYINEAADTDPAIQHAAQWAANHYAQGSSDPKMLAWAAFWFVKHNVKFVVDESPLFRLGEVGQQDLLISPSVLIRMQHPQEDCDGFTMLLCAILRALGVPYAIVTVAVDGQDPQRWSHVFGMALTPVPLPLDASHGSGPGWMVPAARTFRWQCWSCDGQPVNISRPRSHRLHGWQRSNYGLGIFGLGQDDDDDITLDDLGTDVSSDLNYLQEMLEPGTTYTDDDTGANTGSGVNLTGPGVTASPGAVTGTPSSSSSFNWASLVTGLSTSAASAIKSIETTNLATAGAAQIGNLVASAVPIVLVVVIGGVLISALGNKK